MPSLHPDPGLEYFFKACRKGDREAKAVTVNQSAVRALADVAEERSGEALPRKRRARGPGFR
jgi:hypothetical protein